MAAQPANFSALGRALVAQGKLAQSEANAIQLDAVKAGVSFVQQLVASKKVTAREVSLFAANTFGYPLLDLNAEWTVDTAEFHSKCRNTPFAGWNAKGKVKLTVCGGRVTHDAI